MVTILNTIDTLLNAFLAIAVDNLANAEFLKQDEKVLQGVSSNFVRLLKHNLSLKKRAPKFVKNSIDKSLFTKEINDFHFIFKLPRTSNDCADKCSYNYEVNISNTTNRSESVELSKSFVPHFGKFKDVFRDPNILKLAIKLNCNFMEIFLFAKCIIKKKFCN